MNERTIRCINDAELKLGQIEKDLGTLIKLDSKFTLDEVYMHAEPCCSDVSIRIRTKYNDSFTKEVIFSLVSNNTVNKSDIVWEEYFSEAGIVNGKDMVFYFNKILSNARFKYGIRG